MQERSLLDYWLILYQRRFAIYLVIATSVAASVLIGRVVTPVYEARAAFYLSAKPSTVSYLSEQSATTLALPASSPIVKEDDYKPYVGILKSRQLAEYVSQQYPEKDVLKLLRSDVDFEITDNLVVRVYSRDHDPVLAAKVADAYVAGLNRLLAEASQSQVAREPDYIQAGMVRNQAELRKAEAVLNQFEEKHHIANLDTELVQLTTQKTDLQTKWEANEVSLAANNRRQKALIAEFNREGENVQVSDVATSSPVIDHLRGQLADAIAKLAELETELGKNNVLIIAQRGKKEDLEQQLREEMRRWLLSRIKVANSKLEGLRQQLIDAVIEGQQLETTGKAYLQSLERVNKRLRQYPVIKAQWTDLNDVVVRLRAAEKQLLINLAEVRLQNDRDMRSVLQLDRAEPPKRPAFPIWWLNILVALLGGALAGVGYAFFLNYVDETRQVRTARLVRAILSRT